LHSQCRAEAFKFLNLSLLSQIVHMCELFFCLSLCQVQSGLLDFYCCPWDHSRLPGGIEDSMILGPPFICHGESFIAPLGGMLNPTLMAFLTRHLPAHCSYVYHLPGCLALLATRPFSLTEYLMWMEKETLK
jgi:hypothetical protein